MALDTNNSLLRASIYQVFPRCYSRQGTLKAVENDLERIVKMGFTHLYFLPLHEPGVLNRKGSKGSPYSIRDYYAIDPLYGTLDDFKDLIEKAHEKGLKIITDIVVNHTACDALWCKSHPEYYILDEKGKPTRKIPDWSDIYDLDYSKDDLQAELINMMEYWARFGVDAYRCDVAPIVPIDFWIKARTALKKINPDFMLLAESGEQFFIELLRKNGIPVSTDNELYRAFDVCYCYDIEEFFKLAILKDSDLSEYARAINYQQSVLPVNAVKCWFLENHDQERIAEKLKDLDRIKSWTAFIMLAKGVGFIYAGQEILETHRPSLFEKEDIDWAAKRNDLSELIGACNKVKKQMIPSNNYVNFKMLPYKHILSFELFDKENDYFAYFDVNGRKERVKTTLKDGFYINLLNEDRIEVKNQEILVDGPIVLKI